jgi:hypothetical protein
VLLGISAVELERLIVGRCVFRRPRPLHRRPEERRV